MNWKFIVAFLLIVDVFLPFIFNIIGVSQQIYLNYLIFINALFIFYLVLPKDVGNAFT